MNRVVLLVPALIFFGGCGSEPQFANPRDELAYLVKVENPTPAQAERRQKLNEMTVVGQQARESDAARKPPPVGETITLPRMVLGLSLFEDATAAEKTDEAKWVGGIMPRDKFIVKEILPNAAKVEFVSQGDGTPFKARDEYRGSFDGKTGYVPRWWDRK